MDNQAKLNKPITDEELFDAGINRDVPEREPVPPPPRELPKDMNMSSVGVEYRAMSGITTPPSVQRRGRRRGNDKAYAWVEAWRPASAPAPRAASPDGESADEGQSPLAEMTPIASTDHAADPPQREAEGM